MSEEDTRAGGEGANGGDPFDVLRADPALGPVVEEHGRIELTTAEDPFRRFVVSIVNQQLSSASAAAIRDRLFERFPATPEALLAADETALRETGLSSQKVEYVRNVAGAFQSGRVDPQALRALPDDEVVDRLTEIRGVGVWTAKMFCVFCLAREDVFPVEDLGIRRGMEHLFGDISREEMVERAEPWRPYRSYASRYLWRVHD